MSGNGDEAAMQLEKSRQEAEEDGKSKRNPASLEE